MKIKAYCMPWHLDKSDAFKDILCRALEDRLEIELVDIKLWNKDNNTSQIFCQVAPPVAVLNDPRSKAIWIPMWDNVHGHPQIWWNELPKHIRVVCFSKAVYERARQADLLSLRLMYFNNPDSLEPAQWDKRVILYWNRTGLISSSFIKKFCESSHATKLIFRPDLDPGAPKHLYYDLPKSIRGTSVQVVRESDRQSYLHIASEANIYIAPRKVEGVGLTFIEAMSRGSAVVAYNGPTMNEYIRHKKNGFLLSNDYAAQWSSRLKRLPSKLIASQDVRPAPDFTLSDHQPWKEMSSLDWQKFGTQAATEHRTGYVSWQRSLDKYAKFITEWKV